MNHYLSATLASLLLLPAVSLAQEFDKAKAAEQAKAVEQVKADYTKFEYRIPMRDGVRLFTAVYVPKDDSQRYPILIKRTPYSARPYGADQYPSRLGPSLLFTREKYIFVYQDVRGRWMSEGEFVNVRPHIPVKKSPKDIDESTDTYDTIDWLVKHVPGHNGKVGQWGVSYPGFYTAAGMVDAHPALAAASPQAPVTDWFVGDDFHHNGAFFLPHLFNFISRFGQPRPEPTRKFDHVYDHGTPDGYDFFLNLGPLNQVNARHLKGEVAFWDEVMKHGAYDEFWQARNIRQHLKKIKPAVMTVGGWFDAENLFGALETYRHVEANSPGSTNFLVMGPWEHGQWENNDGDRLGHVAFNAKTSLYYREKIELAFFNHFLKGKGDFKPPEAWVFETGSNRWRKFDAWPPKESQPRSLHLQPGGRLAWQPASEGNGFDEYLSDPHKPVPFIDKIAIGMDPTYMVADQRFAARRPDVLAYQTPELEEDVTLAGPIEVHLTVSTTGTDADWIVKLIDVYPSDYPDPKPNPTEVRLGGFQQLVRGEVMRGKFRNSLEKPEPFKPGAPTEVRFRLQDVCHNFRSGHRIMVQVQSTWFPLVDRNPQVFCDIYSAKPEEFQKATQRVYRSSRIDVRVVK